MNYFEAKAKLKKNGLDRLYLIFGEETYLAEKLEREILLTALPDAKPGDAVYFNADTTAEELNQQINAVPFFTSQNVIFVKNSNIFKERKKESGNSDEDKLLKILSDIPDYSVVVFSVPGKVDKRRRLYKFIAKSGSTVEVNQLRAWDLKDWLQPRIRELGRELDGRAAEYFLSVAGVMENISLGYLEQELQKILLYTENKRIMLSDVKATMASCPAVSVFSMLDALGGRDIKKAIMLLNSQLLTGEHPLRILAVLTRFVRQLWQVKIMQSEGLNSKMIAPKLGLVPFIAEKIARQSQNFTAARLKQALLDLDECDYLFKTGQAEPVRLEMILLNLCR